MAEHRPVSNRLGEGGGANDREVRVSIDWNIKLDGDRRGNKAIELGDEDR